MTLCQSSSAENVSCNVAPVFLSPQCGDTTSCIRHLVSDRLLSLLSKESVHNAEILLKVALKTITPYNNRDKIEESFNLVAKITL